MANKNIHLNASRYLSVGVLSPFDFEIPEINS